MQIAGLKRETTFIFSKTLSIFFSVILISIHKFICINSYMNTQGKKRKKKKDNLQFFILDWYTLYNLPFPSHTLQFAKLFQRNHILHEFSSWPLVEPSRYLFLHLKWNVFRMLIFFSFFFLFYLHLLLLKPIIMMSLNMFM